MAETGARLGEVLGITRRRVDVAAATVAFAKQFDRYGDQAPLKTSTSSARSRSPGAGSGVRARRRRRPAFVHADKAWRRTLKRAGIPDPQPTIHDLRHTHVSGLIADGWDPVEIAGRIGDTVATTLAVYSHEFDARRRGDQRRKALEARYDTGMATHESQQTAADGVRGGDETVDLQAVRNRGR